MSDPLYALSIQQPWIWAILHAGKRVENRTWAPPRKIIGQRIAIHASKSVKAEDFAKVSEIVGGGVPSAAQLVRGGIVATAKLVGAAHVVPFDDPDGPQVAVGELVGHLDEFHPGQIASSPFSVGPWCWVLEDVTVLDSVVPVGGKLGVWQLLDATAAQVREEEQRMGTRFPDGVEIPGHALAEGRRSIRWRLPDGREGWVPTSQIVNEAEGSITVTRWFATKVEQFTRSPEIAP